jgi:hypothetical protein
MKIPHQVAVATMIQFILLSLLGIANGLNSIVSTCSSDHSDCVSNLIVSLIFFILTVAWFAGIWVLSYATQEQRSRRLAQLLIATELVIVGVALINIRGHTDWLSLITSLIDLILAVWIIRLAFRLMRAGNRRIVRRSQPRQRNSS